MGASSSPSLSAIAIRPQNTGTTTKPRITAPSRALFANHSVPARPLRDVSAAMSSSEFQQGPLLAHPISADSAINGRRAGLSVEEPAREDAKSNTRKNISSAGFNKEITPMPTATSTPNTRKYIATVSMNKYRVVHSTMNPQMRLLVPLSCGNNPELWMSISPEPQKQGLYPDDELVSISSPLATRERRINEGNSLNGRKVQKIEGGTVRRERLHCQDQVRHRLLLDGGHRSREATRSSLACTESDLYAGFQDPFFNEQDFEENLSEGTLYERPSGSSTPRVSKAKLQLHPTDDGDNLKLACSTFEPDNFPEAIQDCLVNKSTSISGGNSLHSAQISHRVKKHPSPSKKALGDLEAAFAIYVRLKPLEGGDNTDELATDSHKILSSRDCNKSRRQPRPKCSGSKVQNGHRQHV